MLAIANTFTGFLGKRSADAQKVAPTEGSTNADLYEQTFNTSDRFATNGAQEGYLRPHHGTPSRTNSTIPEGGYRSTRSSMISQVGEVAPEDLEGWRSRSTSRSSCSRSSLHKIDIQDVPEYLSDSDSDYSDSEDDCAGARQRTVIERTSTSTRSVATPAYGRLFKKRVSLVDVDDECVSDDEDEQPKIQRITPVRVNYTANVKVTKNKNTDKKKVTKAVIDSIKSLINVEKTVLDGTLNGVKLTQMCPKLKTVETKEAKVSLFKRTFSNWFQVLPPQVKVDVALTAGDGTFHKENFTSELHLDQYLGLAPRTRTKKGDENAADIAVKELEALDGMSKSELLNVVTALKIQGSGLNMKTTHMSDAEQSALKQMSREELMTVVATLKARVKFLRKFNTKLSYSESE